MHELTLTDTHLPHSVTDFDRLIDRLAKDVGGHEATGKGVSGAVGVDDLVFGQLGDWIRLGTVLLHVAFRVGLSLSDDGRFGAVGDDDDSRLRRVLLWQVGNLLRYLTEVLALCVAWILMLS